MAPELALAIERQPGLGFVELNAENHDPCVPLAAPRRSSWIGVKVVVHGVSLSLGGADHPEPDLLTWMARLATQSRGPLVSEHVAFVRAGGIEAGPAAACAANAGVAQPADGPEAKHRNRVGGCGGQARATPRPPSEEEMTPSGPPIACLADQRPIARDLCARLMPELVKSAGIDELDPDFRRRSRSVGCDCGRIADAFAGCLLDHLAGADGRYVAGARPADRLFDGYSGQAGAEQFAAFAAAGTVASHEEDRAAERAAEGGVDPDLADQDVVEPQVLPGLT